MNSEYKYPILVGAVFAGSAASLAVLLQKYASLTVVHFVGACRWIGLKFFSSGVHYVGFFILTLVALAAAAFLVKAVFSFIKTQRKINRLLACRTDNLPEKLLSLSLSLWPRGAGISLLVVNYGEDHAFSFGIFSKKLLISIGLVEKLSEKELEAVLLHEYYHLRRRHVPVLLAGEVMAAAMFFLPILKDWMREMRLVFEQKADAYTISRQKTDLYLRAALAKVMAVEGEYQPYPAFAFARRGVGSNSMLGRIFVRRPTPGLLFSLGAAAVGVLLIILPIPTNSHAPRPLPDPPGRSQVRPSGNCLPDPPGRSQV